MVVSIQFLGMQRVATRIHSIDMPITENTTVNDALEYVRRQYPDIHLDEGVILITVNQQIVSIDQI